MAWIPAGGGGSTDDDSGGDDEMTRVERGAREARDSQSGSGGGGGGSGGSDDSDDSGPPSSRGGTQEAADPRIDGDTGGSGGDSPPQDTTPDFQQDRPDTMPEARRPGQLPEDDVRVRSNRYADEGEVIAQRAVEQNEALNDPRAVTVDRERGEYSVSLTDYGRNQIQSYRRQQAEEEVTENVAEETPYDAEDVVGVRRTDSGFEPVIADEAREAVAREQFAEEREAGFREAAMTRSDRADVVPAAAYDMDDLEFEATDDGVDVVTGAGAEPNVDVLLEDRGDQLREETRQEALQEREQQRRDVLQTGVQGGGGPLLSAREDEIRVESDGETLRVGVTDDARERIARQQFDLDRDPQRVFSGTERVPVGFSEDDLEFQSEGGDVAVQVSDEATAERLRQRVAGRYDEVEPEDVKIEETDEGELRASVEVQRQGRPTNAEPQTREQEALDTLSFGATRWVRAADNPVQVDTPDAPDVDVDTNTRALFSQARGEDAGPVIDVDVDGLGTGAGGGALTGAAAAGVAAPEPVSTGAGLAILGAAAAGGLVASSVELNIPEEQNQGELEVGTGTAESELEPGQEVGRTEIEVPEEETVVQPEELGVPQEAVDQGEIDIEGGGRVTDGGEIVIPAGTTQVASETRYEDEEEVEEEEEAEEEEEDEVVVSVPSEFIPEEEVVIGGEAAEEPVDEEVEEVEEAEEEEFEEVEQVEVIQGQDTAFPEDTRTTSEFDEQPAVEQPVQPAQSGVAESILGAVGGATAAGAGGAELAGIGAMNEETAADAEAAAPEIATGTAPMVGTLEGLQVAELGVQAQQPALQSVGVGLQAAPGQVQAQAQPQATVVENVTTQALGEGFAQATAQATDDAFEFPEFDAGGGDDIFDFGSGQGEILTDFVNPLSGGVLETSPDVGGDDVVLPGF